MIIQIIFVGIFALNIALIWLAINAQKFSWYAWPGGQVMTWLPLATVFFNQPRFELDYFWWRVAGVVAIVLGIALRRWAIAQFKKGQTGLITSGPYALLRHPLLLSMIFISVGWWWVWAAVYSFYFGMFILALIWFHANLEEKLNLAKEFGDQYRRYRRQTGMFWVK
ncbi:hypothetical protein A3H38_06505 [candidate division WOR-1 bacterium RIFCSPLOWO2_02_FULL_46_20]|uniref:Steroid 5-alpha reductase C-terminal domain-containing protein n=2 Tax=Saganbacteria TaxID=1703751 RepID=A0A1F4RCE7_UNCSA|nr:MAG: hypothetical protein A3J44_03400 [candidate division WOR-1 bacterium RIFCSPHIGHO2_02_FULL_45_12]OGC05837.1 MAG: hypothetical protein A3H38_06505 [candidate division WOR-1 bacterium RIFCSPLOWO2_02_FULL_46_20]OGC09116.1 MAG: hypothetical protein A3F86_01405 [candidate division WOR-1 bacterium RIFCSPLOWO2_12_FULL_45_9]